MKFTDEETLIQALKMRYREPFFLLQHHFWMDFTKYVSILIKSQFSIMLVLTRFILYGIIPPTAYAYYIC